MYLKIFSFEFRFFSGPQLIFERKGFNILLELPTQSTADPEINLVKLWKAPRFGR